MVVEKLKFKVFMMCLNYYEEVKLTVKKEQQIKMKCQVDLIQFL